MTNEKLIRILDGYLHELGGIHPRRYTHPDELVRFPLHSTFRIRRHLLWMCVTAKGLVEESRTEKAMRWLGFIQGALWASGKKSLTDLKHDSMPDDEVFDPDGGVRLMGDVSGRKGDSAPIRWQDYKSLWHVPEMIGVKLQDDSIWAKKPAVHEMEWVCVQGPQENAET